MIVDDEELVAKTMSRALTPEHVVVTCTDPRDGLRRMLAGEQFAVVFCDLTMPHLMGDELYEAVRRERPDLAERFVFITGGVTNPRLERFLASVDNERLDKPVSPQNLRAIAHRWATARA